MREIFFKLFFRFFKNLFLLATICFAYNAYAQNLNSENKNQKSNPKDIYIVEDNVLNTDYLKKLPQEDYILGPGDKFTVNLSKEYPELLTTTTIDGEGTVFLPLLKKIYVENLSIKELTKLLTKAYSEYIKYPELDIVMINYRPIKILVLGEVNDPGFHTLNGSYKVNSPTSIEFGSSNEISEKPNILDTDLPELNIEHIFPTVLDAIRSGGGITVKSDLSSIELTRKESITNGAGRKMTTLNFSNSINEIDQNQDIRIYDGDSIKINKLDKENQSIYSAFRRNLNPKFIRINVVGRVNQPGTYNLTSLSTLNDAIDIAGGAKALRGQIRYLTINNDGTFEKRAVNYRAKNKRGSYKNPYLKDGDLVIVGNSLASSSAEIINELTEPFKGLYSTYGLIKAISD